jgi:hypothetical protein
LKICRQIQNRQWKTSWDLIKPWKKYRINRRLLLKNSLLDGRQLLNGLVIYGLALKKYLIKLKKALENSIQKK